MAGLDRHDRLAAALRANLKRRKQPGTDQPVAGDSAASVAKSAPAGSADGADQRQSINVPK